MWVWSEEEEAWAFSLYSTRDEWSSRHFKNIPVEIFSSNWRQCAVRGIVIKNLFFSASSLLAQAMLEVLISAPIIYLFVCLCLCLSVHISACTLSNIEAKKKFEFLEAMSGAMDAHLRYFKQARFHKSICGCSPSFGFMLPVAMLFLIPG